jgi:hypothetical protein
MSLYGEIIAWSFAKGNVFRIEKSFCFIFMSSYPEMSFLGPKRESLTKYSPKIVDGLSRFTVYIVLHAAATYLILIVRSSSYVKFNILCTVCLASTSGDPGRKLRLRASLNLADILRLQLMMEHHFSVGWDLLPGIRRPHT